MDYRIIIVFLLWSQQLSAQNEHTVAVKKEGTAEILTKDDTSETLTIDEHNAVVLPEDTIDISGSRDSSQLQAREKLSQLIYEGDENIHYGNKQVDSLTLESAVRILIEKNSDIQSAVSSYYSYSAKEQAAWYENEPRFVSSYDREINTSPSYMNDEIGESWSVGVEGEFLTGTGYSVKHTQQNYLYKFTDVNKPSVRTDISLSQSLLQGIGFGNSFSSIRIAKVDEEIALQKLRSIVSTSIADLEKAYWNLAYSQEVLRITRHSAALAKRIYDESSIWFNVGKISNLDVMESSANYAERQTYVISAESQFEEAQKNMRTLLSIDSTDLNILIAVDSIHSELYDFETVEHIRYEHQPDLLVRKGELEREKIIVNYYRDRVLPILNLTGSYTVVSTAYSLDQAREDFFANGDFSSGLKGGLEFVVPLAGSGKARKDLLAEKYNLYNAQLSVKQLEQELLNESTALRSNYVNYKENLENIKKVEQFREEILAVELARLRAGKSNVRLLFEKEQDLLKTYQWKLDVVISLLEASIQARKIGGTILSAYQLEIIEDGHSVLDVRILKNGRREL